MVAGNVPFVGLMAHTKVRFRKRVSIKVSVTLYRANKNKINVLMVTGL